MKKIPKIIHQIAPANTEVWHPLWHKCHASWKEHFSDHEIKLWNDKEDIDNFIKENYSQYWNLYYNFPFHIMRIDFVRLCLLHKFGGIYADMDIFCYKNFDDYLTNEIYFLENKIIEYTDSAYENSMMASIPGHRFLEELMKYSKTSFIHFRNKFDTKSPSWRSVSNDNNVNNSTGSGMIAAGINYYKKYFKIDKFECELFNNRPGSYDSSYFTKHVHTSVWGKEYLEKQPSRVSYKNEVLDILFIINGGLFLTSSKFKEQEMNEIKESIDKNNWTFNNCIEIKNFNFYHDYTDGVYLKENNLEFINEYVIKR